MWDGIDRAAWQRCLLLALEITLGIYGPVANAWDGTGEFSGAGDTTLERTANAKVVANAALPTIPAIGGQVGGKLGMGIALMRTALAS